MREKGGREEEGGSGRSECMVGERLKCLVVRLFGSLLAGVVQDQSVQHVQRK